MLRRKFLKKKLNRARYELKLLFYFWIEDWLQMKKSNSLWIVFFLNVKAPKKKKKQKEFPFSVDEILPVLEIIAPANPHAAKLKGFIELQMPPGFPVQVGKLVIIIFSSCFTCFSFPFFSLPSVVIPQLCVCVLLSLARAFCFWIYFKFCVGNWLGVCFWWWNGLYFQKKKKKFRSSTY